MKIKGCILMSIIILLILSCSIAVSQQLGLRKPVDINKLDMQGVKLPTEWFCNWCEEVRTIHLDWINNDNEPLDRTFVDDPDAVAIKQVYWAEERTGDVMKWTHKVGQ